MIDATRMRSGCAFLMRRDARHPPVERLVGDQLPVPRRVQRRARPLLHRQMRRVRRRAQELRLRTGDVDDRVQADRLGDDAAPAGVERPHDVAVGLGRRRGGEQERVLEPEPRERDGQLRSHDLSDADNYTSIVVAFVSSSPAPTARSKVTMSRWFWPIAVAPPSEEGPDASTSPRRPHPGRVAAHRSRRADRADPRRRRSTSHIPLIEEAGKRGVQILGLQEIFNGPYFCPSQDAHWYDIAEPVPGPDHRADGRVREEVPDGDGRAGLRARAGRRLLQHRRGLRRRRHRISGKYRKNHIPHTSGFWEKYFFKPGNLGYPVFKTRFATIGVYICYDRHFPEGARLLGLNGAEIVFNPSATVAGLSQYLWKLEQPAHAVANGYFMACSNRVGTEAPWNIGRFYGSSYFVDPRGNFLATGVRGQGRARRRRDGPRHDRRGPPRLAVLSRPPAGDLRADGGATAMSLAHQERHHRHRHRSLHRATCSSRARRSRPSARR